MGFTFVHGLPLGEAEIGREEQRGGNRNALCPLLAPGLSTGDAGETEHTAFGLGLGCSWEDRALATCWLAEEGLLHRDEWLWGAGQCVPWHTEVPCKRLGERSWALSN